MVYVDSDSLFCLACSFPGYRVILGFMCALFPYETLMMKFEKLFFSWWLSDAHSFPCPKE